MTRDKIALFVRESNAIEGIFRNGYDSERDILAHEAFLALDRPTVFDVESLVSTLQRGAVLRRAVGLDIYVGNYRAPPGGPGIEDRLRVIVERLAAGEDAWRLHLDYEILHPFTDDNGRSGRAIWLWAMRQADPAFSAPIGFLHQFYYQTLERSA